MVMTRAWLAATAVCLISCGAAEDPCAETCGPGAVCREGRCQPSWSDASADASAEKGAPDALTQDGRDEHPDASLRDAPALFIDATVPDAQPLQDTKGPMQSDVIPVGFNGYVDGMLRRCDQASPCPPSFVCLTGVADEGSGFCTKTCTGDVDPICGAEDWMFCISGYCMRFCDPPSLGCSWPYLCPNLTGTGAGVCLPPS